MRATPQNPVETVTLGQRERRLRYSQRTRYRIGTLPGGQVSQGRVAQLAQMIWALLDEKRPREEPEDIADYITDDNMEELVAAVGRVVEAGAASGEQKKTASSDSGRGPSSGAESTADSPTTS